MAAVRTKRPMFSLVHVVDSYSLSPRRLECHHSMLGAVIGEAALPDRHLRAEATREVAFD